MDCLYFCGFCTPFGRHLYAIGGNPTAASLCGVDVVKTRINAFMLSGFLAGLAGVLYMAQFGGGSIEIGADMSIPLFASVVAGGTSLAGERGTTSNFVRGDSYYLDSSRDVDACYGQRHTIGCFALIAIGMSVLTTNRKSVSVVK